ncbi:uncharacterized protein LOC118600103 [Oryzias melastigma]|uniref:uncharacterized protein LOC118600103 n=1 Tax=Oryzias melastigma TaxID=30732 RepID=UPI00168CFABE|nr:uncharacterized protein LOC118600103 [Oryzias melastigma]
MKMAVFNVRSLLNKSFIINDLILDHDLTCLFLTETWLGTDAPAILTEASPPNFNFLFSIRGGKKGGGTASIAHETISSENIVFDKYSSFEDHAFLFGAPPVLAVTVYRPPNPPSCFIEEFSEFLSSVHIRFNRILITGDFNLHVYKNDDVYACEFLNLLSSMDFKQHVTQATHNRGHTLDLVITYGLSAGVSSVVDLAISDHCCVFFNVTSEIQQEASVRTVRKRYINPEVAASFINNFNQTPAQTSSASCDFMVDDFNNRLQSSLDAVAPVKTKTLRTTVKTPWKTDDIRCLKQKCRRAERRYRKTKLMIHKDIFKEQLKIYNNSIKKARTLYFSNLISENKNNPKVLFKTIDILINKDFNKSSMLSSNAACEDFADHFMGKINAIRSSLSPVPNSCSTDHQHWFYLRKHWGVLSWLMWKCLVEFYPK